MQGASGYDCIITFNFRLVSSTSTNLSATACDHYTSPSGTQAWMKSGMYTDILFNAAGCVRLMTIDWVIVTIDDGVSTIDTALIADME